MMPHPKHLWPSLKNEHRVVHQSDILVRAATKPYHYYYGRLKVQNVWPQ